MLNKEGSSFTNLLKLIKEHGYNKDITVKLGIVTSVSPLKISLGDFSIGSGDLIMTHTFSTSGYNVKDKAIILIDGNEFFVLDKVV